MQVQTFESPSADWTPFNFASHGSPLNQNVVTNVTAPVSLPARNVELMSPLDSSSTLAVSSEDFAFDLEFQIVGVNWNIKENTIRFRLDHGGLFAVSLGLIGEWTTALNPEFELKQCTFNIEQKPNTSIGILVTNTLWAVFGSGASVKFDLSDLEYFFSVRFQLPVTQLRSLFEERKLAEQLLVIESVFATSFQIPDHIPAADVETIAFCYKALTQRTFDMPARNLVFLPLAEEESWTYLPKENTSFRLRYPTTLEQKSLFGQIIPIGQFWVIVDEARVENYDAVVKQMQTLNGEPVPVRISVGKARITYEAILAPKFDPQSFSPKLYALLNLEDKLVDNLTKDYFEAFAATVEGLNGEQIREITSRPGDIVPENN